MIMLTEKASIKIKEISEAEGIGHYNIRVKVIGGGCSGFTHDLYFDDQILEFDEVFEQDNVKIVIDPLSYQYLDETVIEYFDTEMGGGFKFLNPNVKGSCGCGSSVSF